MCDLVTGKANLGHCKSKRRTLGSHGWGWAALHTVLSGSHSWTLVPGVLPVKGAPRRCLPFTSMHHTLPHTQDLMYTGEGAAAVLRLLCLYCAVHGGIPRKAYDGLRRDFLNTYGHEHLLTLAALQRAGWGGRGRRCLCQGELS